MMPNSCTRTTISSGSGKYSAGDDDEDELDELEGMMEAGQWDTTMVNFGRKKELSGRANHYKYTTDTLWELYYIKKILTHSFNTLLYCICVFARRTK
jgi:hypothetical protein